MLSPDSRERKLWAEGSDKADALKVPVPLSPSDNGSHYQLTTVWSTEQTGKLNIGEHFSKIQI